MLMSNSDARRTSLTRQELQVGDTGSASPWLTPWESILCPSIDVDELVMGCCDLASNPMMCPGFTGTDTAMCDTECEVWPSHICSSRTRASKLSTFSDFVPYDDESTVSSVEVVIPSSLDGSNKHRRRVSFSQFSEGTFVPEDEAETKWYSEEEEINFRLARLNDARRVSRAIERTPVDAMVTDNILECVGIESLVTEGLAQHAEDARLSHLEAVLLEQNMQKKRGISDPERLSKVSRTRSRWTKERARKLATGYSQFLKE